MFSRLPRSDGSAAGASPIRAAASVAASACCFGAIAAFTLVAIDAGASLPAILIGRYTIATVALVVVIGGFHALRLPARRVVRLLMVGGIGQALLTWFGLSALLYVPAATASFLFYTYPAWVVLWAAVRRTERLDARRLIALALSLGGVTLMVGRPVPAAGSSENYPLGITLALLAAVVYAMYIPLIRRAQAEIAPAAAATWICIGAGTIYWIAGAVTGSIVLPEDALRGWTAIAALALLSTVLAFILFLRGLAVLGPVRTAIISTVEPFCTALLAAVVVGQPLTVRTLAGGALIATAVALLQQGSST